MPLHPSCHKSHLPVLSDVLPHFCPPIKKIESLPWSQITHWKKSQIAFRLILPKFFLPHLKKFVESKSLNSIQNSDQQDQKSVIVFVLSWKLISLPYLRIYVLPLYYRLAKNVPLAFCPHSPPVDCNIFPKTLMGNLVFLKAIDYCCIAFFWLIALQRW